MLVLLSATIGPLWIAITVAVGFDAVVQLFLLPTGRHVHDREAHNWVSLIAFLVTAVIGSNLSAAAQERAPNCSRARTAPRSARSHRAQRQRGELAATLLASLSHDLKTPLTVIRTAVENLRDQLPDDTRRTQANAAAAELAA